MQSALPEKAVPVAIIAAPTASGKGAMAHFLARQMGWEIVCMDSMKVYREMEVATAKPSAERRAEVPYHLVDFVDPDREFSIGEYLPCLEKTIGEIRARGREALVVGGTALYLKGYLDGFHSRIPADWSLRGRLMEEAENLGVEHLHERLRAIDPGAARKISTRDLRRIVRALEVRERTGKTISEDWSWDKDASRPPAVRVFGLAWTRAELYARIDRRVEQMVERGLFEEALRLKDRQPPLSRSASQSIGTKEILSGMAAGLSRDEIVARIQQGTRRFAKRQLTWFRKLPVEWIPADGGRDAETLAADVLRRLDISGKDRC